MAISEEYIFQTNAWYDTKKYLSTAIGFPERVLMCVWHSTKLVHANRKQTLQMHWHRCLMFLHRLLMFLT